MDLDHPIEARSVYSGKRIKTEIYGIAVKIMEVKQLTATALLGNCGHQADLVADFCFVWQSCQVMRGVFKQERDSITSTNLSSPCSHQSYGFGGSRQWQRRPNTDWCAIFRRNGLVAEVLTMPEKRP